MIKAFTFALTGSAPAATAMSSNSHTAMAVLVSMLIGGSIYTLLRRSRV